MTTIHELGTPSALIDIQRMERNIHRMQDRMQALGVRFRPHAKTTKCLPVVQAQIAGGAQGITVSTLKEAEQFFEAGIQDILYAVGMVPGKLMQALALRQRGCQLKIITDSVAAAREIGRFGAPMAPSSRCGSRSTPMATVPASSRRKTHCCRSRKCCRTPACWWGAC